MYEFFEELSFIGWLGVALWVAFIISIPIKKDWYFNAEERKPKISSFDKYTYTTESTILFMTIRFIAIAFAVFVIGSLMTVI